MSTTIYSPFVNELKEKMEFEGMFLVKLINLHADKNGKAYLNLILKDKTGEVESRVWGDQANTLYESIKAQDIVRVAGRVNLYQGRKQVVVDIASKVAEGTMSLDRFIPSTAYNINLLYKELLELFETLENPYLRSLATKTLQDEEVKAKIIRVPAAKSVHHAFAGGLLEHTLSVCRILDLLSLHYKHYYNSSINRDLLLVGGLFHDIGKIFELSTDTNTEYTLEGQLIGHHVLGCELIDRITLSIDGFPKELKIQTKHLILAHHGKLEFGSPKEPHTIESLIVHYVDDLDSKINTILTHIMSDVSSGPLTTMSKLFERPFVKTNPLPSYSGTTPGRE
ncbi:MAG: HD domain-containing protein [Oligoflexia bacterium]|nr:HD domain-containing protein [Oligoflexia bacterium]